MGASSWPDCSPRTGTPSCWPRRTTNCTGLRMRSTPWARMPTDPDGQRRPHRLLTTAGRRPCCSGRRPTVPASRSLSWLTCSTNPSRTGTESATGLLSHRSTPTATAFPSTALALAHDAHLRLYRPRARARPHAGPGKGRQQIADAVAASAVWVPVRTPDSGTSRPATRARRACNRTLGVRVGCRCAWMLRYASPDPA